MWPGSDHPLSGDREGKDEVFAFFREVRERRDGTFRIDLHDVLATTDEHAVALTVEHGERNGKHWTATSRRGRPSH